MVEALLLLGGNEGDPAALLSEAEAVIDGSIGRILSRSRDHWTEPWGFADDRLFLNRALIISTDLQPGEIMERCLLIEQQFGRIRRAGAAPGPRPMDIDILLIGDQVINIQGLQVPHPRMHLRKFALAPAADLAPHWLYPGSNESLLFILDRLHRSDPFDR